MDFEQHIDRSRLQRAEDDYAKLQQAVRDSEAALGKAQDDAKAAECAAQASADRGDGPEILDAAEVAVDAVKRGARVAERLLAAAKTRLGEGERARKREVQLATGAAANAACAAKFKALAKARELMQQLDETDAEFRHAHGEMLRLHRAAGREPPANLAYGGTIRMPLDASKIIDQKDFEARLADAGWDGAAFAWTKE